ncbi:hypothetical protein GJ744_001332 [Endocarpon pusillum]|uniref:Uncharacterized protein n=1 Tax=Endocarpon pusillum TaxID=364733 RepID=A0A8H7E7R8_9EURO|nr:hypothetical protein GJ744_001332 [Endocarpon pusillum]
MQALKNEEDGWLVPRQEHPSPVRGKGHSSSYLIVEEAFRRRELVAPLLGDVKEEDLISSLFRVVQEHSSPEQIESLGSCK